jgi:hypothetical protein
MAMHIPDSINPVCWVISRQQVESLDTADALRFLNGLLATPEVARSYMERVDILFHGYDEIRWELFEIPEVRNYVYQLDEKFPYWLFFLSKQHLGLQAIMHCFLPPFLTEEAKLKIHPEELQDLLLKRWFPAMNHVCAFAGISEEQNRLLSDRAIAYFTKGRLSFPEEN